MYSKLFEGRTAYVQVPGVTDQTFAVPLQRVQDFISEFTKAEPVLGGPVCDHCLARTKTLVTLKVFLPEDFTCIPR